MYGYIYIFQNRRENTREQLGREIERERVMMGSRNQNKEKMNATIEKKRNMYNQKTRGMKKSDIRRWQKKVERKEKN
jgi:hypothetical protein